MFLWGRELSVVAKLKAKKTIFEPSKNKHVDIAETRPDRGLQKTRGVQ